MIIEMTQQVDVWYKVIDAGPRSIGTMRENDTICIVRFPSWKSAIAFAEELVEKEGRPGMTRKNLMGITSTRLLCGGLQERYDIPWLDDPIRQEGGRKEQIECK